MRDLRNEIKQLGFCSNENELNRICSGGIFEGLKDGIFDFEKLIVVAVAMEDKQTLLDFIADDSIFVLTNKRVVCFRKPGFGSVKTIDIPLSKIASIKKKTTRTIFIESVSGTIMAYQICGKKHNEMINKIIEYVYSVI